MLISEACAICAPQTTPVSFIAYEVVKMATTVGQKYKCNACGNEVVVTNAGIGVLVCCGKPMVAIGEGFECK